MQRTPRTFRKQDGMLLLEGLIAILIFSLGVLAIVGLQGMAAKQVTEARSRTEASILVDQLLGTMWAGDRSAAALQASFGSAGGGAGYTAWRNRVAATLPGIDGTPDLEPQINITSEGVVTVSVFWQEPGADVDAQPRQHVVTAQIRPAQ